VQFNVPAGDYMMRMVVREPGGLVGSADRRFEIRPVTGPDVSASDLVIGSALGGLPVRPTAYVSDGLTAMLETYGRTTSQLQGITAKLLLRRADNGAEVTSITAELKEVEEDAAGGARRKATFILPLTAVPPGSYSAHAVVSAGGEVVAERTRHVEVLGGTGPALPAGPAVPVVSPLEITRGDLGRKYIAMVAQRAQGTPFTEAARRAAEGRWEEVDLALRRTPEGKGLAASALRGLAMFVREDYAAAATALQLALDAEPSALTAFFLGWAHDGAGNTKGALSAWRSAAHMDPSLVSAHLALADGYLKISEPGLAIQALRSGLAALPASTELQTRLRQLEGRQ
jgi:hypothetical protein